MNIREGSHFSPSPPASHIGCMIGLSLPPSSLLQGHKVSPSACCLPCLHPQMTHPGTETGSLYFDEKDREMAPVLAQNHASPAVSDWHYLSIIIAPFKGGGVKWAEKSPTSLSSCCIYLSFASLFQ